MNRLIKKTTGFSLIELIITILVLGIALAALSRSLFNTVGKNADPMWQSKATHLAQAYLDEIIAMRYAESSPVGGGVIAGPCSVDGTEVGETTRSLYDDVDDYHDLSETGDFLDTSTTSDYSQYTVDIQVSCVDPAGATAGRTKQILVTITAPGNNQLNFSVLRGNF